MSGKHFEFEVKGAVELVCVGGCGRDPKYVIVALEVKDKLDSEDFPRVPTCGECKISYGGEPEKEGNILDDLQRGVEIGEKVGNAAIKILNLFHGRKL